MVLEHLFPEDWLERKLRYAFLLAFLYATVSIVAARLLFSANSGLVAVVFTSLLLMPYISKLFQKEEIAEMREKGGFKLRRFLIDNWPGIKVYGTIFLGVYLAFLFYSFVFPMLGWDTGAIFREQLNLTGGLRGQAFALDTFLNIFLNNWWVLLACFLLALVTGDGAIFFVTWNASVWGAIFGYRALAAAAGGVFDPFTNLAIIFFITLPHVLLEGGAYILAAIAGSVISDDVISESKEVPHFLVILLGVILGFLLLAVVVKILIPWEVIQGFLMVIGLCCLAWLLRYSFDDKKHRSVFTYNYSLFIVAILIFLVAALIESLVLGSSSLLEKVYTAAYFMG